MKGLIPLAGILALLALAAPPRAFAVDVEPSRLEVTLTLDEPAPAELTVSNHGSKPVGVKLGAGPYRHFQAGLNIPTAEDWISFDPSFFTLAPGASSTVTVLFNPPASLVDDSAAEYLAAILVDELPAEGEASPPGASRVNIVPRLALPVYIEIKGRERMEVEISGLSAGVAQPLKTTEGGKSAELLQLDTTLKNLGSVHTRPSGTMAVFDGEGRLVRAMGLGKSPPLLPTATLVIPTFLPLPAPGRYKAVVTVEGRGDQVLQREHRFEVMEDSRIAAGEALSDE